ncbi:hypothetical protein D3C77_641420 [compost metagenome]
MQVTDTESVPQHEHKRSGAVALPLISLLIDRNTDVGTAIQAVHILQSYISDDTIIFAKRNQEQQA